MTKGDSSTWAFEWQSEEGEFLRERNTFKDLKETGNHLLH